MEEDAAMADVLNKRYGNVSALQNVKQHLEELTNEKRMLRNKLEPLSCKKSKLEEAQQSIDRIVVLEGEHATIEQEGKRHANTIQRLKNDFEKPLNQILQLQKLGFYLTWFAKIGETNDRLGVILQEGHELVAISEFKWFKDTWEEVKQSRCHHLVTYLKDMMMYWHTVLREKISREFEKILQSMCWPKTTPVTMPQPPPTHEVCSRFELLFSCLLQIQLPSDISNSSSSQATKIQAADLPLQVMLLPLQKRFVYHFMGLKQTNRLDKPEWYLTQILTWIRDHDQFLAKIVQPILNANHRHTVAKVEFMRVLIQLAANKLETDLPDLVYDDQLLCHTIDEVLLFHREILSWGYPPSEPNLLRVLSESVSFNRWLHLEQKCAVEKMDQLLSSESAWTVCYQGDGDVDDLKIPQCAEGFMTMMQTMTDRYKYLPNWQHRLMFLGLQLELLDDFRLRLLQLLGMEGANTMDSNCSAILNAVNYVVWVLEEWKNLPFYISLAYYKENQVAPKMDVLNSSTGNQWNEESTASIVRCTVFDSVIELLEHMKNDLLQRFVSYILLEVKAKTRPYRKEKWFCIQVTEKKHLDVSPSAFQMLNILKSYLQQLQESIAKSLFVVAWPQVAESLNMYIYEEVVLENVFSEGGAQQIQFDMMRNLFPIFGLYTPKPENYFKEVKESCLLLNLQKPMAMLLKDTLETQDQSATAVKLALEEQQVFTLTPKEALQVLRLRVDLSGITPINI